MNPSEIIPPIAPIDSIPEPGAWSILVVAFAVVIGWRCAEILMGSRERSQGICYWSLGSMPARRRRRWAGWILSVLVAVVVVALVVSLTLWISQP